MMDLYMPAGYTPHVDDFLDPYNIYAKHSGPAPTAAQDPFAGSTRSIMSPGPNPRTEAQRKPPQVKSSPSPYSGYFENLFAKKK